MKKPKICKYKNCLHESREIPIGEEVQNHSVYYHKDCNEERICINQIIDIWKWSVDPYPIMAEIRRAINNITENYGVRPKQLLFHLTWCLNNGWNIRHANGLYYVAKCEEAADAYKKANMPKFTDEQFVASNDEINNNFDYKPQKTGFGRILK